MSPTQDVMLRVGVVMCIVALALAQDAPKEKVDNMQLATFGGGCFWGVEYFFAQTEGVTETAVGYMGGTLDNPTYQAVCSNPTGHAEVVQVTYDPEKVTYEELLELFFKLHDPTQVNRQGPDVGNQYRSVIFFHTPEQETAALAFKSKLNASSEFERPIATVIEAAPTFWRAEEYHQQYFQKKGVIPTCHR